MKSRFQAITLAGVCFIYGCGIVVAAAATISKGEAQSRVKDVEAKDDAVLAQLPALGALIDVVKTDCAAKVPERAKSVTFCECAGALTMELWRSGMDPKMRQRLVDFVNAHDPSKAVDFLQYQGPELYRPLCELAEPDQ